MTPSLVAKAKNGDEDALVALVQGIQQRVFALAIRMLWDPSDAEDATQEILAKIITHLAGFREECAFDTWVHRVACNHLSTTRKRRGEQKEVTFEQCEEMLDRGLAHELPVSPPVAEHALAVEERMLDCIRAMLHCLKPDLRMAYVLGEIFEVPGAEAAEALNVSPIAFRKRLSRARTVLHSFMTRQCGLVNPDNSCRCTPQVSHVAKGGMLNAEKIPPAAHPSSDKGVGPSLDRLLALDELQRVAAVFRSLPEYAVPGMPARVFNELIESVQLWLLR